MVQPGTGIHQEEREDRWQGIEKKILLTPSLGLVKWK
jgi:hypothetical protein